MAFLYAALAKSLLVLTSQNVSLFSFLSEEEEEEEEEEQQHSSASKTDSRLYKTFADKIVLDAFGTVNNH